MKIKHKIFNRQWIEAQSQAFRDTFVHHFINSGLVADLDEMAKSHQKVYIFSGVIRDFFLDIDDMPRDVDIVLSGKSIDNVLSDGLKVVNQFGGAKVQKNGLTIDVWCLPLTWGIRRKKVHSTPDELILTSFFNFSSIVYDYKKNQFIVGDAFLDFMNNRTLDYVYSDNPYPDLCVVNTIYYSQKMNCGISERLKRWIYQHEVGTLFHDYEGVQKKHFGKVLYDNQMVEKFIKSL
jgi:hypothetical protein